MSKLKLAFAAAVICGGFVATAASALPVAPIPSDAATNVEQVRWVCGPYRCWRTPGYYGYRAYGAYRRPYWGGGWRHRHWRRW
jgi:hypothetical protein